MSVRCQQVLVMFLLAVAGANTARAQACDKKLDAWEVKDPKTKTTIEVWSCQKLGSGVPGVQVKYNIGGLVSYCAVEPEYARRMLCRAPEAGSADGTWLLADRSVMTSKEYFVKHSLFRAGNNLKLRVEVKVKGSPKVTAKEYALPFRVDCGG